MLREVQAAHETDGQVKNPRLRAEYEREPEKRDRSCKHGNRCPRIRMRIHTQQRRAAGNGGASRRRTRDYACGPAQGLPDTNVDTFAQALYDDAKKKGWVVISMKSDWKRVFAFE